MLYIRFGHYADFKGRRDVVWDTDLYFNNTFEPEWLEDDLVKEMIQDVDKSTVLSPYCIQSPILGQIAPEHLSGGVKGLILMLKDPDIIVNASRCGDNCSKWILKIAEQKDLHIILAHYMIFMDQDITFPMKGIIENDGTQLETVLDYEHVVAKYSAANII